MTAPATRARIWLKDCTQLRNKKGIETWTLPDGTPFEVDNTFWHGNRTGWARMAKAEKRNRILDALQGRTRDDS